MSLWFRHLRLSLTVRSWPAFLLALTLFASACGSSSEEVVYVTRAGPDDDDSHGAYTPIGRSGSARVHADGAHEPAAGVTVGPAGDPAAQPYVPIRDSQGPLVHPASAGHVVASPVALAHERAADSGYTPSSPSSGSGGHESTAASAPTAPVVATVGVGPTPAPRQSLGARLGTPVPSPGPRLSLPPGEDELAVVAGPVESVYEKLLDVKTTAGVKRVRTSEETRIEREGRALLEDLKPGQFVGAVQAPGGPATLVRIYTPGPSMPRAGVVPLVGQRTGQITVFGSIVTLEFGGMLLNTGSETTPVTLRGNVEVLKPLTVTVSDLGPGAMIVASGVMGADGVLTATALRVTSEGPLAR